MLTDLPRGRPQVIALAGPNGAGKSSFYEANLKPLNFRFVNADILAKQFGLDPYVAAQVAENIRQSLVKRKKSFIFETVFSDPKGEKLAFLSYAAGAGYSVVLLFIGVDGAQVSETRVRMRVQKGGHDVPVEKLKDRYERSLANLRAAVRSLPYVRVFDNSDLTEPYREIALFEKGKLVRKADRMPAWAKAFL